MENIQNPELQLVSDFIQFTNRHVFLTGKAGTGKTTFLHSMKRSSPKRMIVVAPTGVAAINAGGVTIHSFFQLPFHPYIPALYLQTGNFRTSPEKQESSTFKMSREKVNIIKSLDLLIIDEISMVRADILDAVDFILRRYKDRQQPFGGIQLLMIGDLQQLAPVVKEEDWEILGNYYDTAFFFGCHALRQTDYVTIELQHVYRQRDLAFINLLNRIRDNQLDAESMQELNKRYDPHFDANVAGGYITLTTHNAQSQVLNDSRLAKLPDKVRSFKADIQGEFPEYAYPTAFELQLKRDAQVMFVKNDLSKDKLYFNGKIGRILDFEADCIQVQCPEDNKLIAVGRVEWQNMKYTLDKETKEIQETVIGTFTQYPLKLAWAITIHKSQGLTFDNAIIDARAAFAHGQVYVALSRCRTLEGIVLSTPLSRNGIFTDPSVSGFIREAEHNRPDQEVLKKSKKAYQHLLITELFDFNALQRCALYGLKLADDHHKSILGNIQVELEQISVCVKTELTEIFGKFNPQLLRLLSMNDDSETNDLLQERITKACSFFSGIIAGNVCERLNRIDWQTDNKEIRKSVNLALEKLRAEASLKLACLQACQAGFQIKKYLDAKARASVELPSPKLKQSRSVEDNSGTILHPALFNRLKSWRTGKALQTGLPQYMILPQKTMVTLVNFLPQSMISLKTVKGMGNKKADQFGPDLLDMIRSYCQEKNIDQKSTGISG